jgi:hypothetical protein
LAGEIAVPLRAARPQARLRLSAIDQPFGETPSSKSVRLEEKRSRGQRVLDGPVGASNAVSFEKAVRSIIAMML